MKVSSQVAPLLAKQRNTFINGDLIKTSLISGSKKKNKVISLLVRTVAQSGWHEEQLQRPIKDKGNIDLPCPWWADKCSQHCLATVYQRSWCWVCSDWKINHHEQSSWDSTIGKNIFRHWGTLIQYNQIWNLLRCVTTCQKKVCVEQKKA